MQEILKNCIFDSQIFWDPLHSKHAQPNHARRFKVKFCFSHHVNSLGVRIKFVNNGIFSLKAVVPNKPSKYSLCTKKQRLYAQLSLFVPIHDNIFLTHSSPDTARNMVFWKSGKQGDLYGWGILSRLYPVCPQNWQKIFRWNHLTILSRCYPASML